MNTSQLLEKYAGFTADDLDAMTDGEFIGEMLVHSTPDVLSEVFSVEDAEMLEEYALLVEDEDLGLLTEDSEVQLEGIRDALKKVKDKVKSKIPDGMKMVFGKLVKIGKATGKAAVATGKAAVATGKAVSKGAKAVGRTAVKAKRGAQAGTYAFSKAGKDARKLAKDVRDTHGREAAKQVKKASKDAYQKASRAGETSKYASGQAASAAKGANKKVKKAVYHDSDETDDGSDEKPKKKKALPVPPPRGFKAKAAARTRSMQ